MSDFNNIGKMMILPIDDIKSEQQSSELEFLVIVAAEAILQSGGRNWVPIIVQDLGDYKYQVVSNYFVYAVAHKAKLQEVWCIVIDPKPENIELAKILTKESFPKVNLSTASKETILVAMQYLAERQGWQEKLVIDAANKIALANRETWLDFSPLKKLKCGISGKKLDEFEKIFYLSPPPPPPPLPEIVSIKRASREEIFERLNYLSTYKIGGFESIDPDPAANAIFSENKAKWKSLNPIAQLECGITKTQLKTLKTVFTL